MNWIDAQGRAQAAHDWSPPPGTLRITTLEAHTEGEPLRVIFAGVPEPETEGRPVAGRRLAAIRDLEPQRRALMWEPRGHADMYGALLLPPERPDSAAAVLFLHNEGWSTMCGHGILALGRVLVETGLVEASAPESRFNLDTPAGPVRVVARVGEDGRVGAVRFENVASWVQALDREVSLPDWGTVRYDLAFGGAFYAFVDAPSLGLDLHPESTPQLVRAARAIKTAAAAAVPPAHPDDPSLSFLYGVIFTGPPDDPKHHSRHVCVFADGEVDRSPTGTGVSARAAILHARGSMHIGDEHVIESVVGGRFTVRIIGTGGDASARPHVIPEVEGRVAIVGRAEWFIEPDDPFPAGFLVR
ncbi:MAG: proline racemase family protein [Gemmatimonadetes bacterium]|nr:proline racemase family protein [Gemmatimonadota bacterium]